MTPQAGWELYRSFLAVHREGSLSGAARALALTQPTIGRHLDTLEQALGTALFVRSRHGLAPTETAEALLPYAETMASAADALVRAASGRKAEARGTVRITASEVVGAEVLPPILAELRAAHPGLVVELVLSNRTEDLLRRDADIAVRMVRPVQQALIARRIGDIALGLYAHRSYLDRHGTPVSLTELHDHALIGFDQDTPTVRSLRSQGLALTREMFALRTDSDLAKVAAVRAGFGIGVCQEGLARRDPHLVRVLSDEFAYALETWVVMHENLRASRSCRTTFDALVAGLCAYIGSARSEAKSFRVS
jgi:DNA-binding transcriptional LysR family regulator